ncbi:efflux RND transporter periplasmic adaptor subunit [Pleomorphomonas carboxyditropha]|nr:efflux RND transporter periplasmic adaptor subunit [Pleomorphomonas carboxyditropha]
MRRNRVLFGLALLALAAALAGVVWTAFLRPIDVTVVRTERNVPIQVFGLGTVEARVLSRVGFEMPGTLTELHADSGDRVAKGTLLAHLDSREQAAKAAQARAALKQAESSIRQSSAALERADATARQKEQINKRRQQLVASGGVSTEVAEDAQAAVDIAQADLSQARSTVEVARANREQAEALLLLEETRLSKHALYAPYDAIVVARNLELGSMLTAGEQLFTLVDPTSVWVLAYVDESKAGQLKVGQPAEVMLRSMADQRFAGEVARIDIESDRVNEERRVYVRCVRCPTEIHLGEQAEVLIDVDALAEARLVPQAAVLDRKGSEGVIWTVEDGRLARRLVSLGQTTLDGRMVITGGLTPEARIVAKVESGFRVGRPVSVKDGEAP